MIEKVLLKNTNRISFELSNLCNYSSFHKKCPLSLEVNPRILKSKIVYNVLDTLKLFEFQGEIAFHTYNEPLIDPRLFQFISYAKQSCPNSNIYICTNGFYLDQNLAIELEEVGVTEMYISAYTEQEFERISKIDHKIPYKIAHQSLDDRLNQYTHPIMNISKPCFAPLNEICISRDGTIVLCCLDWKKEYAFGDLNNETFENILKKEKLKEIYNRLSKGDRFLEICKRCDWTR
jgi:radical SAM protein with 4Fe4S-binding SPASM domain